MLQRLLELLKEGGTHHIAGLANALGTTPELVRVMLQDLARMGELKKISGGCGDSCSSCPVSGQCAAGEPGQVWTLAGRL